MPYSLDMVFVIYSSFYRLVVVEFTGYALRILAFVWPIVIDYIINNRKDSERIIKSNKMPDINGNRFQSAIFSIDDGNIWTVFRRFG